MEPGNSPENDTITAAREDWQATTTALERVQQVIEQTTTPQAARKIAEEALVSEPTARKHLSALVEIGTATAHENGSATQYARNEDLRLYQRIRDLATEHNRDELLATIQQMNRQLQNFEDEYDAASPEEVATRVDRDSSSETWADISEWQTTERNLHIANAALNYQRARNLGATVQ